MVEEIEMAVQRAVDTMRDNLGEPLTIDDLARAAIFSKFHFTRVFQRVTGLSPGRFLSAMRLQEAKRLLSTTSLPVTEISVRVGYSSVGTFSSRFKSSVGVSPTKYRQYVRVDPQSAARDGYWNEGARGSATVRGDITSPQSRQPVFVGLFPDCILQGMPVRCAVLPEAGPFVLSNVPAGTWHLLAEAAIAPGDDNMPEGEATILVGGQGPITVWPGSTSAFLEVQLHPVTVLDPPVLLALCDLRTMALRAAALEIQPDISAFEGLFSSRNLPARQGFPGIQPENGPSVREAMPREISA